MFDILCRSPDGLVKQRTLGCVGSVILGRRGLGFRVWGVCDIVEGGVGFRAWESVILGRG